YKIWADMIAFDHSTVEVGEHQFCAFAGLRDGKNFVMNHADIMEKYGHNMKMVDRIPEVLSGAMGNQMYVATFPTEEEMNTFYRDVTECR
ncbi:MAG: carbamoylphosphate synthase large subunit, partial [Lachnospiraceae bacterium]|nr:carbamoylphosphate synthase large subunit [Lachnospiraceae bacterium]